MKKKLTDYPVCQNKHAEAPFRSGTQSSTIAVKQFYGNVIGWTRVAENKDEVFYKPPTEVPSGGRFFYFTDTEGNILEVVKNAFVVLDEMKNAIGHLPINL